MERQMGFLGDNGFSPDFDDELGLFYLKLVLNSSTQDEYDAKVSTVTWFITGDKWYDLNKRY